MAKRILVLIAIISTMALASGCYFLPAEEKLLEPPVVNMENKEFAIYPVAKKDIIKQKIYTGNIVSASEESVFFKDASGAIKTIYVKPGEMVKKGQILASLETRELDHEIELQQLYTKRAKILYDGVKSREDANRSEIESAKLEYEIEQTKLDNLTQQKAKAQLTAPVSGQVSFAERLRAGEWVDSYRTLVKIIDPNRIHLRYEDDSLSQFELDMELDVRFDGELYRGKVTKTPKEAKEELEENTQYIEVSFIKDMPSYTAIGNIADIIIVQASREDVVVIPKNMVKTYEDRKYVFILEDGERIERDIKLGIDNATEVEVVEGLEEGEQIIIR